MPHGREKETVLRGVAQLVAHLVWDQGVAGSNPVTPTNEKLVPVSAVAVQVSMINRFSGCSAVGSASGLGPGGRRFESCHPDKESLKNVLGRFFCFHGFGLSRNLLWISFSFSIIFDSHSQP